MSDTAQKGLSAFLRLLAKRHAGSTPAEPPTAAGERSVPLDPDEAALVVLAADISAGCSREAAATAPPAAPPPPPQGGLLGFAGGIVKRAWEVPATVLGIRAAVGNLARGGASDGTYR